MRTDYGKWKLDEQRRSASVTFAHAGTAAVLDAGGTPAWIYVAGAVAIGLALLVVILQLTGFTPTHH